MRNTRRAVRIAGAVAALLVAGSALSACIPNRNPGPNPASSEPLVPSDAPANLLPFYSQHISWQECPSNPGVECTWVTVPIDYSNPSAGSMKLRVAYAPASAGGSQRYGFLFTNPGGPGGSGLDIPFDVNSYVSDKLITHFDILGWDPRGVGQSDPIRCLNNKQKDALVNLNATPTTPAEIATFTAAQKAFALACKTKNPKTYDHVGTVAAAHDMDIIRAVIGEKSMYYLGFSYGTYLGAWYAEQFPKRITRMVLDGAINPALDNTQLSLEQLKGFERALYRFLDWCPKSSSCPSIFKVSQDARIHLIIAEQNLLAKKPAKTDDPKRPLTESLFQTGMVYSLYDDTYGWPGLAGALDQLMVHGDGTDMLQLADAYLNRQPDGTYPDNSLDSFNAITCYDKPPTPQLQGTLPLVKSWSAQYPVLGSNFAWANMTCGYWPVHTDLKPGPLHAKGSGPILVLGTTYDPATPYDEAVALSQQLDNGHLVTWIGDGHTAYNRGSECVRKAVDDYFLYGKLPKKGLVCPYEGAPQ